MAKKLPFKKKKIEYYDYDDFTSLIEIKYNCNLRDYAGKFRQPIQKGYSEIPYQDFWHWMLDYWGEFHRGAPMYINWGDALEWAQEDAVKHPEKTWVIDILTKFVAEFGTREYIVIHDW